MRTVKGPAVIRVVGILMGLALGTGAAQGLLSTERPGSILIFPKVVNTEDRDTIIQISNTSNMLTHARCFYIDGSLDRSGRPRWQVTDFEIWLTRQQPTHWVVSQGRRIDPTDNVPGRGGEVQNNAGLDPGAVPAVAPGFTGELRCVEVDDSGSPIGMNSLKGEALIGESTGGDLGKYNGIAIPAVNDPNADTVLNLDNIEYSACPAGLHFNFGAEGASDPVLDGLGNGTSIVNTTLTMVPCSADYDNLIPGRVTVRFDVRNEFEEVRSGTTTIDCWRNLSLAEIPALTQNNLGTQFGYAQIIPTTPDAVLGIATVTRTGADENHATASTNLHFLGNAKGPRTVMRLPHQ